MQYRFPISNEKKQVFLCDLGGVGLQLINMGEWWDELRDASIWDSAEDFKIAKRVALQIAWEPFECGKMDEVEFQILFRGIMGTKSKSIEEFWHHYVNIVKEINMPLIDCLWQMRDRGIVLALLSNLDAVRHHHIYTYRADEYKKIIAPFHYLFFSYMMGARKPEPEVYHRVFRKISTLPQRTYYIDDWQPNIEGMAAAISDMPRENMHLYHVDRHEDAVAFFRRHGLIA